MVVEPHVFGVRVDWHVDYMGHIKFIGVGVIIRGVDGIVVRPV
jgi:hypothetical protein